MMKHSSGKIKVYHKGPKKKTVKMQRERPS